MKYVYPKLSERDYCLFRCGGSGLGNILFTYARALSYAEKNNCKLIWPTWPSFKLGPILRREKDKRFYTNLFCNNRGYISGIQKMKLLATKEKISEEDALNGADCEDKIIVFSGMKGCFSPILEDSQLILKDIIKNLHPKSKQALKFDGSKAIGMHVRLGDFTRASWEDVKAGNHNSSIPIEWYVQIAKDLRSITRENTKIFVFSDGTDEELSPLLELDNTERISFGTAIGDIIGLSKVDVFVASGSSFSMWARYLGRKTTIMLPNQEKQKILFDNEENKEISALEHIPEEYIDLITKLLV